MNDKDKYQAVNLGDFEQVSIDELIQWSMLLAYKLNCEVHGYFNCSLIWCYSISIKYTQHISKLCKQLLAKPYEVNGKQQMIAMYEELMNEAQSRKLAELNKPLI